MKVNTQVCENLIYPTRTGNTWSAVERHTVQLIGFPAWRNETLECPPFLVGRIGGRRESLPDSPALEYNIIVRSVDEPAELRTVLL